MRRMPEKPCSRDAACQRSRIVETGHGTSTRVGAGNAAESTVERLLDRLDAPVASNPGVSVEGGNEDFAPRVLPDLYAGEPLVLLGAARDLRGVLTVTGSLADKPWRAAPIWAQPAPVTVWLACGPIAGSPRSRRSAGRGRCPTICRYGN
jgi:hypothetical protein